MMKPIEFLKQVEVSNAVECVKVNDLPVWQILRWHYADAYEKKAVGINISSQETVQKLKFKKYKKLVQKVSNGMWNIKNQDKEYSYMLFTDRLEERTIEGKISDKIAHGIMKALGKDILVCVNPVNEKHRSIEDYYHKQYLSTQLFELKRLKEKVNFTIDNENVLLDIEKQYDIKVNYYVIIKDFFQYVEVFKKQLKKTKPKVIFVNCYYNIMHQALIYSAHLNNIKVIEFQHGIINNNHYAYNIFKPIGKAAFSDYIFVFGDYVKDIISTNFIQRENIYSIGNFYIENVLEESLNDKVLQQYFIELRKKFLRIAVVTSQVPVEEELIKFLKAAAELNREVLYIFIPRFYNKDFTKYNFPENIIIHKEIDFYHTVAFSDVHLTVYSTCAIEALFYGAPNILINLNGLSKDNFGDLLGNAEYTTYVETSMELAENINNLGKIDKDSVMLTAERFYKRNNMQNIIKAMKDLKLL